MNKQASRRAFMTGKALRPDRQAIRPPGAIGDEFYNLCQECNDCVPACPENIISIDGQGWPALSFDSGSCTFCTACAEACPTGALEKTRIKDWPWLAKIAESCLALNGVSCRVCQDACAENALRFRPQLGGLYVPELDAETCTGCGACVGACPAGAVTLKRNDNPILEVSQ
ncbi:ferredoxin-type protein NapF [Ruegeria arenilitoris]|uniref:ferredoxin-type protein NapF n=1 Tax=Ruegeria arenilitoris TaxID=1173585 RepID=UPI00147EA06B|nr:ferredoxin-type protein NapF [Ruegeria arenilitoris]